MPGSNGDSNGRLRTIITALGLLGTSAIVATAAGHIAGNDAATSAIVDQRNLVTDQMDANRALIITQLGALRLLGTEERKAIRDHEARQRGELETNLRRDITRIENEIKEVKQALPAKINASVYAEARQAMRNEVDRRMDAIERELDRIKNVLYSRRPPDAGGPL